MFICTCLYIYQWDAHEKLSLARVMKVRPKKSHLNKCPKRRQKKPPKRSQLRENMSKVMLNMKNISIETSNMSTERSNMSSTRVKDEIHTFEITSNETSKEI